MTFDTIFTVRDEYISRLDPDDAVRFTAELLWAEAARLGLPSTAVSISVRINVPDGGVDASIDVDTPPDSSMLRRGRNVFQIKAGDFKPWQESQIRNELLGKRPVSRDSLGQPVRDCMDAGGQYVLLCTGVDLTPQQRDEAVSILRQAFLDCEYKDPRVEVISHNQLIGALKRSSRHRLRYGHRAGRRRSILAQISAGSRPPRTFPRERRRGDAVTFVACRALFA